MGYVACSRNHVELGKVFPHTIRQRQTVINIINRIDDQRGIFGTGGFQQIKPGGIAVINLVAKFSEQIDLVGIVIQHHHAHAVGQQNASNDLSKSSETCDDYTTGFINRICIAFCLRLIGEPFIVHYQQERCRDHR